MNSTFWQEGIFLLLIIFGPLAFGTTEVWSVAVFEGLTFSLVILTIFSSARLSPRSHSFLPAALFILALALLQWFNRISPEGILPSWLPFTVNHYETGSQVLLWSAYAGFLYCASHILVARGCRNRFIWVIFLLGALIAIIGIAQQGQGDTHFYGLRKVGRWRMPFGPYPNHNHAANLMVMSALIGTGLCLSRFFKRRARDVGSLSDLIASQGLILFLLAILAYGIVKANSRGAWLSIIFATWIVLFLACSFIRTRLNSWVGRSGLVALGLAAILCFFYSQSLRRLTPHITDNSFVTRASIYRSGWKMFQDSPLLGWGVGSFSSVFPAYQAPVIDEQYTVKRAHSDWLEILLGTGLAGFVAYISVLLFLVVSSCKAWLALPPGEMRPLMGGVLAALFSFILHGFIDFPFHIPANAVVFLAILSWCSSHKNPLSRRESTPENIATIRVIRFSVSGIYCLMIFFAAKPALASYYFFATRTAPLAAHPYLITRAYSWDANPFYSHKLAEAYLKLSEENPLAKGTLLREALTASSMALERQPLNKSFADLHGVVLWHLGRKRDARPLMRKARK